MNHMLDITDGQTAFVSANTMGWHKLGQLVQGAMDAETALREGLLGEWNVRKQPLFVEVGGQRIQVPGKAGVVRDNPVRAGQVDVLGTVGEGYEIIQNEQHVDFLNTLVDESGAHFDTAGSIDGGRRVFVTMELPGHINIGNVDPVGQYLAAINSHDGSMSYTIMVTPVRIVCNNTLNLAFQNKSNVFRIRHTSGAEKALRQDARRALDLSFDYLDSFQAEANQLLDTAMTQKRFEEIVAGAFGPGEDASPATVTRSDNKVEQMVELFAEAQTQDGIRDTAWAGLMALTEWADHFAPTRGDDRDTARAQKAVLYPTFKNQALELMRAG